LRIGRRARDQEPHSGSRFPANLGLFLLWIAGFLKTCGLLVFGLVLINICLFFCKFLFCGLPFFQILRHFCSSIYCKTKSRRVCSFWAGFFGFSSLFLYLTYLLFHVFLNFPPKRKLGLFFRKITHFGLVFQICLLEFTTKPGITEAHTSI